MACIEHNCQCGYCWFDNESYSVCTSCGECDKGSWDEDGVVPSSEDTEGDWAVDV